MCLYADACMAEVLKIVTLWDMEIWNTRPIISSKNTTTIDSNPANKK